METQDNDQIQDSGTNRLRQGRQRRRWLQRRLLRHHGRRQPGHGLLGRGARGGAGGRRSGPGLRQSASHRRAAPRRDSARLGQRRRLRLLPGGEASRAHRQVIGVDMTPEMVTKARGNARRVQADERRISAGRDRASARRGCFRRRDPFELRDQSVARQGRRLPRGLPRAQGRRASGHLRRRRARGDACRARAERRGDDRLRRRLSQGRRARSAAPRTPASRT